MKMKQLIMLFVATVFFIQAKAQTPTGTSNTAVQLAQKIAKKMKDTLNLTGNQKNRIYDVNMDLHNQKQEVRVQYATTPAVWTNKIQAIEKTRDSLYKPILTVPQYDMYKQKKRNLVSNN